MTTGLMTERDTPDCPHCGACMDEATVTLGDLLSHWPIPGFIETGSDGYSHDWHRHLKVECPQCRKPSALAIDGRQPVTTAKLVAARTLADHVYVLQQSIKAGDQASAPTSEDPLP
ncbi:MAG: hypothetical protein ACXIVF_15670 [Rhizobiaceae bacterium]